MKLYDSIGPNPHVVRMFAAEKGLELETVTLDLMKGENRQETHLARNPMGQMPTLDLGEGTFIAEITAICEYLEEVKPEPVLIGSTPEERALTRMWTRRIDLNFCEPVANGFRYSEGLPLFNTRIHCLPEAADGLKALARRYLRWLNAEMEGRPFVVGERFTLADILLYCFIEFAGSVGQALDPENKTLSAWLERIRARPSAKA